MCSGETMLQKKKHQVKYSPQGVKDYPVRPTNDNPDAFYCLPCKKLMSYSYQCLGDVKKHCREVYHGNNADAIKQTRSIFAI